MTRYIFIAGGVMSGIGKGVATASIGRILESKGFKATAMKIDPYINVDAGTMNPVEHGEVFVTEDGFESDQDGGNYERFMDITLSRDNYITTGRIYQEIIEKERNLEYGGKCVEVVPHVPNEVIDRIKKAAKKDKADFILIEIGGTVGEYQNLLFLEAARMMKLVEPKNVVFILVSYLPVPAMVGEMKTKPTQYAVRTLNMSGIQPDIILGRSIYALDKPRKKKISIFCNMATEDVISAPDAKNIYEVPLNFEHENLSARLLKKFGLKARKKDMADWMKLVDKIKACQKKVKIGVVGKYFESGNFTLADSYISVIEAIKHACWQNCFLPEIHWLSSEKYETDPTSVSELYDCDGVLVPGGFGNRGIEGKIKAIEYCRKNNIPFFGLCLGMQLSCVEFARNACGLKDANSTEFNAKTEYPIISIMQNQKRFLSQKKFGATMRLGAFECDLKKGTLSRSAYGQDRISERHRHRYEFNEKYSELLEKNGLKIAGTNPDSGLVEIVEITGHPFFVATQFHPEFKSKPLSPHPLFVEFIKASILRTGAANRRRGATKDTHVKPGSTH